MLDLRKIALLATMSVIAHMAGINPGLSDTNIPSKPKVVIELFTSQGCSSCPPADKYLGQLVKRDDVVALSLPVDYWDYLGWKDTLARPENTLRQRTYARNTGTGSIYTPQIVVSGIKDAVGSRPSDVESAIKFARNKLKANYVPMRLTLENDKIIVRVAPAPEGASSKLASIMLALITIKENVAIRRGENGGRKITYYNVLRDLKEVGIWNGTAQTLKFPSSDLMRAGLDTCFVFLQTKKQGAIIGVAKLESPGS